MTSSSMSSIYLTEIFSSIVSLEGLQQLAKNLVVWAKGIDTIRPRQVGERLGSVIIPSLTGVIVERRKCIVMGPQN